MPRIDKIMTFNEWKNSDLYSISKWFIDKKLVIEKWFAESFPELEYDYFEWDDSDSNNIYTAFLYFGEEKYQYQLQVIIDTTKFVEGIIEEINLVFNGYVKHNNELLGTINKTIQESEFVSDLLIELINEFKIEYAPEEDENGNPVPKPETSEINTSDTNVQDAQNAKLNSDVTKTPNNDNN